MYHLHKCAAESIIKISFRIELTFFIHCDVDMGDIDNSRPLSRTEKEKKRKADYRIAN